ncbi:GNAT family N-acetyltransferase [Opitutus terrae]|uniref:GCN5-related N-acetyltransferase n=1 Tax=Opitutus terrae (strain DSM 11246 / JCM 15787 / PB90-1) TaxID=452637 RepID=B1ZXN4_OPITP|nr:GNAT family N-acetyltransferase [Opitutus terrae]ACB74256.1 GCN5-related N-acetyltransferase [Opitutus terrae PB90-1]
MSRTSAEGAAVIHSPAAEPPLRPPDWFETPRLFARRPREADAAAVFAAYASDPEATRYLAWRPYAKIEPLANFLRQRAAGWETGDGEYAYLLCHRGTDAPIGSIGVMVDGARAMFGYVLGRAHWNRGYATEALCYLVRWAAAEPRVLRAWAYCATENVASARVMAKAGLQCEGVLRRWQMFPNLGPEPRDCVFYAQTK